MRRLLGPFLLTPTLCLCLVAAGCGDDASSATAEDPTSTPTTTASPTPSDGPIDFQEIALISQTAAGGDVDTKAVRLDDPDARGVFMAQFERRGFGARIDEEIAAATVPEGHVLIGAVVSIGCDVPPGVEVTGGPDGWLIEPLKVEKPLQECFAPVTTVAVVAVPA